MRLIYTKTRLAMEGLVSFVVWTSVLLLGALNSFVVLQLLLISGMRLFFVVHR